MKDTIRITSYCPNTSISCGLSLSYMSKPEIYCSVAPKFRFCTYFSRFHVVGSTCLLFGSAASSRRMPLGADAGRSHPAKLREWMISVTCFFKRPRFGSRSRNLFSQLRRRNVVSMSAKDGSSFFGYHGRLGNWT